MELERDKWHHNHCTVFPCKYNRHTLQITEIVKCCKIMIISFWYFSLFFYNFNRIHLAVSVILSVVSDSL